MADQMAKDNKFYYVNSIKSTKPHLVKSSFEQPSNLVIQKEPHAPRVDDPTGEPESLYGRIDIKQMGMFAAREKPKKTQITQDQSKMKKKPTDTIFNPKKKTKIVRIFPYFF